MLNCNDRLFHKITVFSLFYQIFNYLFTSYFLLSVCCCCLCVLEACDTKTNSLYVQTYLTIKLFLTLICVCVIAIQ